MATLESGDLAIRVENLCVDYGALRAVDGLSFQVARGEIYALLGPNGAGKTTTVEVLEGHRRRTSGEVLVLGDDPHRAGRGWRERVGIVLQSGGLEADLTVAELVRLYASFYAQPRPVDATIAQVGLTGKRKARVRTLSGGQLRRLDLALALVGDPELLFLDEPTTGFDPNARREAWDLIAGLRELGKTVLLTSHYLDEVQHLADRVGVLRHGRLIAEATPDTLAGRDTAKAVITFHRPGVPLDTMPDGPWPTAECHGDHVTITTSDPTRALFILTAWATSHGSELPSLTVTRPSLEQVYLELTDDTRDRAGAR